MTLGDDKPHKPAICLHRVPWTNDYRLFLQRAIPAVVSTQLRKCPQDFRVWLRIYIARADQGEIADAFAGGELLSGID
jgi:hypothetical protein